MRYRGRAARHGACRACRRRLACWNLPPDRPNALKQLNDVLVKEGFEAFYAKDKHCYLRHVGTNTVTVLAANPHRPLPAAEVMRRHQLAAYLDRCSEDELIEEVLLPLFRRLGFHRITAAGHKDKVLEYGKDIWMRYTLPTRVRARRDRTVVAGRPAGR